MYQHSKKSALLLAAIAAFGLFAQAAESTNAAAEAKPAARPLDLFANDIVAQGQGVKITRAALDDTIVNIRAASAARGQEIPPAQMKMVEAQVLDRLIGMQLLNSKATDADKAKGAETAKTRIASIKEGAGSEEALNRQLKTAGLTLDELTKKVTEEGTAEAVVEREVKFEVSDADVKKFYDDNPGQFEQPEMVHAAHVLISTRDTETGTLTDEQKAGKRKLADDILKRAKAGEDFGKLAKDYSDDPGSKNRGGEYTFPRGQMVPEFEAAAFALETNQISDVVTTQFGYHIIKVLDKKAAGTIELAKAGPDIKKYLLMQGMQKLVPPYMDKLRKEAGVEILNPELKKMEENVRAAMAEKAAADAKAAEKPVEKPAAPAEKK
jgi:peptidyl-prolyl cis-trans isomerase C